MKRYLNRTLSLVLCLMMALALLPAPARAAAVNPAASANINKQDYVVNWATTVKSYLYENTIGGLTRVEYTDGKVIVEDYDSQFRAQASRTIQPELPIWGGFCAGKDYNFLIFGQGNPEEDNNKEVIRIVKYSKDWKRLGVCSIKGANTVSPFLYGSVRCDEYNGYLYIHTCHTMYADRDDGLNHQASVMLNIRESDMEYVSGLTGVSSSNDYSYVSHSFNQFVLVDAEGRIVTMDHGDAYPRGLALFRYNVKAGQDRLWQRLSEKPWDEGYRKYGESVLVLKISGKVGDSNTGVALGGFAETSRGYINAYTSKSSGVYLAFADKNLSGSSSVRLNASYDGSSSVPVLAPAGLDGGYVMWTGRSFTGDRPVDSTLSYARYDAKGNAGEVKTATAPLSDCAPIYWNGKVVWYVTNNSVPTFYMLDANGVTSRQASAGNGTPAPAVAACANTQTVLLDGRAVEFPTYALLDTVTGGLTNYIKIKLRDLAWYLNGTRAQFSVDWSAAQGISLTTGRPYILNGSELYTPFSGSQPYKAGTGKTTVNSTPVDLASIVLTDDSGGDYTYFKLRDLGRCLGFNVSYIDNRVVINTNEPYSDDQ